MNRRLLIGTITAATLAAAFTTAPRAGREEKLLHGSYRLAKRVGASGTEVKPPDALGFLTFTETHRTVIMKWKAPDGTPVSVALIARYTLEGGKYCETVDYGVQSNLGQEGVSYDPPQDAPQCTPAVTDASGLAFDIPSEKLRVRVTRDGIIATTPRWTDTWEKTR